MASLCIPYTSTSAPTTPSTAYSPLLHLGRDLQSSAPSSPPSSAPSLTSRSPEPAEHVRRPKNPFILFRCDFVKRGVVPASVERDHRTISRIAGRTWRMMSPAQKRPWELMAALEKAEHAKRHPDYKYKPATRGTSARTRSTPKRAQRQPPAADERCDELARLAVRLQTGETLVDYTVETNLGPVHFGRRRSSSCPPARSATPGTSSLPAGTFDTRFHVWQDYSFAQDWTTGIPSNIVRLFSHCCIR